MLFKLFYSLIPYTYELINSKNAKNAKIAKIFEKLKCPRDNETRINQVMPFLKSNNSP